MRKKKEAKGFFVLWEFIIIGILIAMALGSNPFIALLIGMLIGWEIKREQRVS